jgi:hypothetical protein
MDSNHKLLANRKFQHTNSVGSKTTWSFNADGSKVNIKAGWLGINTVNSTINVESLGDGKYVGKGFISQKFSLDGNRIKSGPVLLTEIFE